MVLVFSYNFVFKVAIAPEEIEQTKDDDDDEATSERIQKLRQIVEELSYPNLDRTKKDKKGTTTKKVALM